MSHRNRDRLEFSTSPSCIGMLLVATGDSGVVAVLIGESGAELLSDLRQRFPNATLVSGGSGIAPVMGAVLKAIEDPSSPSDIALDLRGTAFQQRVWNALRAVPAGETPTYRDIANAIGAPRSVRAVAAACAANPVAVLVPCHRVIRGDGSLAGYRWGLDRKRELLARERAFALAA